MFLLRFAAASLAFAALMMAGCRSALPSAGPSITLQVDETAMKAEILQHVPIGTPVEDAQRIMVASGFDCAYLHADGDGPPALFCSISKIEDWPVSRRWMISLYTDHGKVTSVDVGTGLIGP